VCTELPGADKAEEHELCSLTVAMFMAAELCRHWRCLGACKSEEHW
jgi:hypothetical protein